MVEAFARRADRCWNILGAGYIDRMPKDTPPRVLSALAVLYFVWGSTYIALKLGVKIWPPFSLAASRFGVAGLILLLAARLQRGNFNASWRQIRAAGMTGLLLLGVGNGVIAVALQWVNAGTTALLIATVLIWMTLFDALRPAGEGITAVKMIGAVLGLAGVASLVAADLALVWDRKVMLGEIAVLGAAMVWAAGSIYNRYADVPRSLLLNSSVQMMAASVLQILMALFTGESARLSAKLLQMNAVLPLLYLIVFGSIIGFTTFTWLLHHTSPALTATYGFVNPLVALLLGALLLDEKLSSRVLLSGGLIICSIILLWWDRTRSRRNAARDRSVGLRKGEQAGAA